MENLDKNPAARKYPIKDNLTLKAAITGSYLEKDSVNQKVDPLT